jgi:hypothetical protein
MNDLKIGILKIAAIFSSCGGPLFVFERLKPRLGTQGAFLLAEGPAIIMFFGAFWLDDDLGDRFARFVVKCGRRALYLAALMHAYAVWCFASGLRVSEQYLYYTGIVAGLIWSAFYLRASQRWFARSGGSAEEAMESPDEPIEPT